MVRRNVAAVQCKVIRKKCHADHAGLLSDHAGALSIDRDASPTRAAAITRNRDELVAVQLGSYGHAINRCATTIVDLESRERQGTAHSSNKGNDSMQDGEVVAVH